MDLNTFWFQFRGLSDIHCLFQGRSAGTENDGNISLLGGENLEKAKEARQALFELCAANGMDEWAELRQVHGNKVVEAGNWEALPEADGIMTDRAGIGLMIKTADCQPLLFTHKSGKYIMAIHCGWRGNRMHFPYAATLVFCDRYKIHPRDIFVVRGPSLGPACAEFTNYDTEWGNLFDNWYDTTTKCMDLWTLAFSQLMRAGIPANHIFGIDLCTAANHERFFSWRRDKTRGRQASIIWIDGRLADR